MNPSVLGGSDTIMPKGSLMKLDPAVGACNNPAMVNQASV